MDEQERGDAEAANAVSGKPGDDVSPVIAPGDGAVERQSSDTHKARQQSRSRRYKKISENVALAPQTQIDSQRPAQQICGEGIKNRPGYATQQFTERRDRLVVVHCTGQGVADTSQENIPGTHCQHQSQRNRSGRIPDDGSQTSNQNYVGTAEKEADGNEAETEQNVAIDGAPSRHQKGFQRPAAFHCHLPEQKIMTADDGFMATLCQAGGETKRGNAGINEVRH